MSSASYIARDYQVELFQHAVKENVIIYLPTGSGKTFIAALVIREKAHEVLQPLKENGRRTVFLVPTVVLAQQQAAYLKRHTQLKVKEYFGSMGVDFWNHERWLQEFEENHVLVMTAQIFVDILNHHYFSMNQVNLLIIDECHSAVKDAPMRQVMEKMDQCKDDHNRPRVLGLTAALFRKKVKPNQVDKVVCDLMKTMNCTVKTPKDISVVMKNSTKPCEIFCMYSSDIETQPLQSEICSQLSAFKAKLQSTFPNVTKTQEGDRVKVLSNIVNDIEHVIDNFGIFGVSYVVSIYEKVMPRLKIKAKSLTFGQYLGQLGNILTEIQKKCHNTLASYSVQEQLKIFTKPRVLRLFEILRQFKAETLDNSANVPFCGIVFVERRCTANVLFHCLKVASIHYETLLFLKPLFTVGQAAGFSVTREKLILDAKQKKVMDQFRGGSCNLLVATSVLEEGVDVPSCNLVIRFDKIKTYCDYVQTKGRARAKMSLYFLMMREEEADDYMNTMAQFHAIEQLLMKYNIEMNSVDFDQLFLSAVPPYLPFGTNGPRVTLESCTSLMNRYCGHLARGSAFPLLPNVVIEEVVVELENEWAQHLNHIMEQQTGQNLKKYFRCRLLLPLNSPLREEIVGQVMPSKRLAKRIAYMDACRKLHQMGQLDDVHLFPVDISKEEEEDDVDDLIDEDIPPGGPRPGTNNRVQIYEKYIPSALREGRIVPGENCFLYALNLKVTKETLDSRKVYIPSTLDFQLALLIPQQIPLLPPFPILTRAGEIQVEIVGTNLIILEEDDLEKLKKFHQILFEDVIYIKTKASKFDFEHSLFQYLIVPIKMSDQNIDYNLVSSIIHAPRFVFDRNQYTRFPFVADRNEYHDAVIIPWYVNVIQCCYVDEVTTLTPNSRFPSADYSTYADYYNRKYGIQITDWKQPLLSVSREFGVKNFISHRGESTKIEKEIHLVPEFCIKHSIPCSLWKQFIWIPSILHRLTGLLVAEEFRTKIVTETGIGLQHLPCENDSQCNWPPLTTENRKQMPDSASSTANMPSVPVTKIVGPNISCDSDAAKVADTPRKARKCLLSDIDQSNDLDSFLEYIWSIDFSNVTLVMDRSDVEETLSDILQGNFETQNNSPSKCEGDSELMLLQENIVSRLPATTVAEQAILYPDNLKRQFDKVSHPLSHVGPSPGMILEAITVIKANDGFNLERLETVGDSFLKVVVSIYTYIQTLSKQLDEGRLTKMRIRQICNRNLYRLGKRLNLGTMIRSQWFDVKVNFLAPCFQTAASDGDLNPQIQHKLSDKTIADSIEALIGCYLLTTGSKATLKFMEWIGIKVIPDNTEEFNPVNGFPITRKSPIICTIANEQDLLSQLVAGMGAFEQQIKYRFKNPALLLQAFSHASYFPNRLTSCYERLEFLGDAVLDYLITRFLYDDKRCYKPGELTDLRSALVNNITFAVLAVRHGFHRYLKHLSQPLNLAMDQFIRTQENNGHQLVDEYFLLEHEDDPAAIDIEIPKVLGDIFESIAGAIFLDSDMSLDTVWQIYYPFMEREIEKFSISIPKTPIRALYELYPSDVIIRPSEKLVDGRMCVAVEVAGQVFKGIGNNTRIAKCVAAKFALQRRSVSIVWVRPFPSQVSYFPFEWQHFCHQLEFPLG